MGAFWNVLKAQSRHVNDYGFVLTVFLFDSSVWQVINGTQMHCRPKQLEEAEDATELRTSILFSSLVSGPLWSRQLQQRRKWDIWGLWGNATWNIFTFYLKSLPQLAFSEGSPE